MAKSAGAADADARSRGESKTDAMSAGLSASSLFLHAPKVSRFIFDDRQHMAAKAEDGYRSIRTLLFQAHLQCFLRGLGRAEANLFCLIRLDPRRNHNAIGLVHDLADIRENCRAN